MANKRFNQITRVVTSFDSNDVFPIGNGTLGDGKMGKDTLLELTAQNALAGNVAPEFDPTRTVDNPYLQNEKVVYNGKLYVFKNEHYGAWVGADADLCDASNTTLSSSSVAFDFNAIGSDKGDLLVKDGVLYEADDLINAGSINDLLSYANQTTLQSVIANSASCVRSGIPYTFIGSSNTDPSYTDDNGYGALVDGSIVQIPYSAAKPRQRLLLVDVRNCDTIGVIRNSSYTMYAEYDCWYDKDGNFISSQDCRVNRFNKVQVLTKPSGACFLALNTNFTNNARTTIYQNPIVQDLTQYSTSRYTDKALDWGYKTLCWIGPTTLNTGRTSTFWNADGSVGTSVGGTVARCEIDVSDCAVLKLHLAASSNIYCVFEDKNGNVISALNNMPYSRVSFADLIVSVPDNAVVFKISNFFYSLTDAPRITDPYVKCIVKRAKKNQWSGKTWYAYGTSLTGDVDYVNDYYRGNIDTNTGKYPKYLKNFSDMKLVDCGAGGQGIYAGGGVNRQRICNVLDGKTEADLITLECMANDASAPFGTVFDHDTSTFLGCLAVCIQYLQENTSAQIVIIGSPQGRTNVAGTTEFYPYYQPEGGAPTYHEKMEAMRTLCDMWGVYFIDPNKALGYYRKTNELYVDNIHHTEKGGLIFAKAIWEELKNIPNYSFNL